MMSIRFRVTLALLLVGFIPIAIIIYLVNRSISQTYLILASLGLLAISAVVAVWFGSRLTTPILKMINAADQVSQGNWDAITPSDDLSELGKLNHAVYSMTQQLKSVQEKLERNVVERTHELDKRTELLSSAAQVAREASAIRDRGHLLEQVTSLIADKFGFYHVGIFLVDEGGEYAILEAANSEGGQRMLERGHKLRIGEIGLVSYAAETGKPRVAEDVGVDKVYFHNPDLPGTKSEIALPLKIRERVIGVLDIQSLEQGSLEVGDINVLQIVADQVALALENARLFTESQRALQDIEQVYGQRTLVAWGQRLQKQPIGYRYNRLGVEEFNQIPPTVRSVELLAEQPSFSHPPSLVVPIRLGEEEIGKLTFNREADQPAWTEDDKRVVEEVLMQVMPAVENARLLEETQARATREQAVNVISTQIRGAANLESILQNTVRELGMVLGSSRTFIQLGMQPSVAVERDESLPTTGGPGGESRL